MKILLVKLSSLGDVLHNLPVVWDIRRSHPDAQIDWVVEEAYAQLLEPLKTTESFKGIDRIITFSTRRWKKELKSGHIAKVFGEFADLKKQLKMSSYDRIVDTQGLLKSALIATLAKKSAQGKIVGIGNRTEGSGYEPLARVFYDQSTKVPLQYHAVDRSRAVIADALGLPPPDRGFYPPQFYPKSYLDYLKGQTNPFNFSKNQYVMCFHATARLAKSWSLDHWTQLGKEIDRRGYASVFPWGNEKEKIISEQIVKSIGSASIVPNAFSIQEAFILIAQAKASIGVDTGLTHLSAILNQPTIEIYVDSPVWKTEGYWSSQIHNLGDTQKPPSIDVVKQHLEEILRTVTF